MLDSNHHAIIKTKITPQAANIFSLFFFHHLLRRYWDSRVERFFLVAWLLITLSLGTLFLHSSNFFLR
jgi:hypothetical protein